MVVADSVINPVAEYHLYDHQQVDLEMLQRRGGLGGLFSEMRVGKCRPALAFLDEVGVKRILIVGPHNVFSGWESEINATPIGKKSEVIQLSRDLTTPERAKALQQAFLIKNRMVIVLTNTQGFWREPLRSTILKWAPEAVIADEAHRFGHRNSRQSKFLYLLADRMTTIYRIPVTGTPLSKKLEKVYSIYRFMDASIFGKRWIDFQNRYLVMGGYQGYQVIAYKNLPEIQDIISKTSHRALRDECWDLPKWPNVPIEVPLSKSSVAAYEDMRKRYITELGGTDESGREVNGVAIARIVLTASLRLQQITSGFCKLDTGVEIDIDTEKTDACIEKIEDIVDSDETVVVFCRFRRDISRLCVALDKSGIGYQYLIGGMPQKDFDQVIVNGRWNMKQPVLVSQVEVGAEGISMPAHACIFYSIGNGLDPFQQARSRTQGSTQKNGTYYYMAATVNGKKSIDHKVYEMLDSEQDFSQNLLRDKVLARRILE